MKQVKEEEADILMYRDPSDCSSNKVFHEYINYYVRAYDNGLAQDIDSYRPEDLHEEYIEYYNDIMNYMIRDSMGKVILADTVGGFGLETEEEFFKSILSDVLESQIR